MRTPLVEITSLSAIGTPVAGRLLDAGQERVQLGVARVDRRAVGVAELARRELAAVEQRARLLGAEAAACRCRGASRRGRRRRAAIGAAAHAGGVRK